MPGLPDPKIIIPGNDCPNCSGTLAVTPKTLIITFSGIRAKSSELPDVNKSFRVPQLESYPCVYRHHNTATSELVTMLLAQPALAPKYDFMEYALFGQYLIFEHYTGTICNITGTFHNEIQENDPEAAFYFGGEATIEPDYQNTSIGTEMIRSGFIPNAKKARWNRAGVVADGPPGATFQAKPPDSYEGAASIDSNVRVDLVISRRDKSRINIKYNAT